MRVVAPKEPNAESGVRPQTSQACRAGRVVRKREVRMDDEELLANIDREAGKSSILLRPRVATTADRHEASRNLQREHVVYFDWQQHWDSIKTLFERTDVRYAACQHLHGRRSCKYCRESWFKCSGDPNDSSWPPLKTDGCNGKVFPLLLDHDGRETGGDGSALAEFAFSVMPDTMADQLMQEQLSEIQAIATEAHEDEDSEFEAFFEVICKYQDKCKTWLAAELDDARLLCSGPNMWHSRLMPLTFRLAQLLAPDGAILELRVTPCPSDPGPSDPGPSDPGAPPSLLQQLDERLHRMREQPSRFVNEAWESAAVVDVTNQVVYTLDRSYFSELCQPAHHFIEGKETVRRWLKDGGIPFAVYTWLRRRLPLDLGRDIQTRLLGRDVMPIPKWLDYADATVSNWLQARRFSYPQDAWSRHDCLSKCHPADGHCAECDAYHTIDAELESQFGPFWWGGLHTHGHGMTQLKNAHTLLSTRLGEATRDLRPHMQRVCASLAAALDEEEA